MPQARRSSIASCRGDIGGPYVRAAGGTGATAPGAVVVGAVDEVAGGCCAAGAGLPIAATAC